MPGLAQQQRQEVRIIRSAGISDTVGGVLLPCNVCLPGPLPWPGVLDCCSILPQGDVSCECRHLVRVLFLCGRRCVASCVLTTHPQLCGSRWAAGCFYPSCMQEILLPRPFACSCAGLPSAIDVSFCFPAERPVFPARSSATVVKPRWPSGQCPWLDVVGSLYAAWLCVSLTTMGRPAKALVCSLYGVARVLAYGGGCGGGISAEACPLPYNARMCRPCSTQF